MTLSEFVDYLYGIATGALGWSPSEAWAAPMPEIYVALKARVEWFNGPQSDPADKASVIAAQLRGMVGKGKAA